MFKITSLLISHHISVFNRLQKSILADIYWYCLYPKYSTVLTELVYRHVIRMYQYKFYKIYLMYCRFVQKWKLNCWPNLDWIGCSLLIHNYSVTFPLAFYYFLSVSQFTMPWLHLIFTELLLYQSVALSWSFLLLAIISNSSVTHGHLLIPSSHPD